MDLDTIDSLAAQAGVDADGIERTYAASIYRFAATIIEQCALLCDEEAANADNDEDGRGCACYPSAAARAIRALKPAQGMNDMLTDSQLEAAARELCRRRCYRSQTA